MEIRAELGAIRALAGRSGFAPADDPYQRLRTFGGLGGLRRRRLWPADGDGQSRFAWPADGPRPGRSAVVRQSRRDPAGWVSEVQGILGFARPAVAATGGPASLGDSGMELDWPYLDPALNLDTIVAKQATEKTQIASVKVKILKGSQPIDTYAGGSDVATS